MESGKGAVVPARGGVERGGELQRGAGPFGTETGKLEGFGQTRCGFHVPSLQDCRTL